MTEKEEKVFLSYDSSDLMAELASDIMEYKELKKSELTVLALIETIRGNEYYTDYLQILDADTLAQCTPQELAKIEEENKEFAKRGRVETLPAEELLKILQKQDETL